MKLHPALFGALAALVLTAAEQPKPGAVKKEMAKLQGVWIVATAEENGKPEAGLKGAKVTFAGDTFTRQSGSDTSKGTYKLNPAAKPAEIDVTFTEGALKGKSLTGIYVLEGDTLKVCTAAPGKKRPSAFASKAGSDDLLVTLTRDKAQAAQTPPSPPPPPPVAFADKNLEAAVRAVLQDVKGPLTDANLVNVYVLEAPGKGITSLQGLDKCKNLALLKLSNNQVSDLAPLKDLGNLQSLDLAGNKITDVGPLAGLAKLQYLELSNNQVASIAPLQGLSSLSALYLTGNKITDIAPLAGLTKLSSLSLGRNQVKDLGPLAKVTRLTTLDLNDNQIEDLRPLTGQTELSLLMLERNKIVDLTPLVQMVKADAEGSRRFAPYLRLYLKGNPLQVGVLKSYGVRVDY